MCLLWSILTFLNEHCHLLWIAPRSTLFKGAFTSTFLKGLLSVHVYLQMLMTPWRAFNTVIRLATQHFCTHHKSVSFWVLLLTSRKRDDISFDCNITTTETHYNHLLLIFPENLQFLCAWVKIQEHVVYYEEPRLLAEMIYFNCWDALEELLCSRFVAESWGTVTNGGVWSRGQGF